MPVETVDDVGTRLDEGRLEHVREKGEDRVQRRKLLLLANFAVLDAGQEFGKNSQVQNERGGKKGILYRY